MKERLYNAVATLGINIMSALFPEYFAVEPLRPTDRYVEYPFALGNLPKPPCRVLDVGCSGSILPYLLMALGYEVYGIDIRRPAMGGFFFSQASACDMPYQDDFFDAVTAISTIEHIGLEGRYGSNFNEDGDREAINEIHRVLKPEGVFLLSAPFSSKFKVCKHHRVYDNNRIVELMDKFIYSYNTGPSPEADYDLVLVEGIK